MLRYYVVDAFTDSVFKGNQAGVCLLDTWLEDTLMQNIAMENNLAETAFVVKQGTDYELRWFTPEVEIDLCGHATLATAFIISKYVDEKANVMRFKTKSGWLMVTRKEDVYEMDFPSRKPTPIEITKQMEHAIGCTVKEAHVSRNLLLVLENEQQVKEVIPDFTLLKRIPDVFGIIITAKGDTVDFVSRYFAPGAGIPEDPVTGSSHCTLIPYWSEILGKENMIAKQLSKRGGVLYCQDEGERVKISGKAMLYLQGTIKGV